MSASPSSTSSTLASATTAPDPTIIGERPNFDLGDDDVIADGGTKIMAKDAKAAASSSPKMSALDSLDAMVTKAKSEPPPPMKDGAKPKSFPPPPPVMKLASKTPTVVGGIGFEVDPTLAVASKESTPKAAPAPAPAPAVAVLSDLADDDLAGETKIDRTQPFDREVVVAAAAEQALALPGLALQPSANKLTLLPSVMVSPSAGWNPDGSKSPSIAPFSVDVPSAADGTQKMPASQAQPQPRYYAPVPAAPLKNNQMTVLAAAIGGGVALCAAALIALIVFATSESNTTPTPTPTASPKPVATTPAASPNAKQAAAQPLGPAKPREAQQSSIRSAVIETPETTPRKIDAPPPARDESGTPVTSPGALPSAPSAKLAATDSAPPLAPKEPKEPKEKKTKASSTAQPPPPPEPAAVAPPPPPPTPAAAAAATPAAPKVTSTVGTIDIPGSLMTVMIDGDYKRVNGGKVVVQCGRHKVNAGRGTQIVDVPCGGSVAVQ